MARRECLIVDSRLDNLFAVQNWFKDFYNSLEPDLKWVQQERDRLNIAVAEGFTNVVRHAHAVLPPETPITIEVYLEGDRIHINIWDHGEPFDPNQLTEPPPGSLLVDGGYGWFLLRRATHQVDYLRKNGKNCLTITHHRS